MTLTQSEITHYTNLWCRKKGIHSKDLDSHPRMDDVVLLVTFREEFWQYMDNVERGAWAGLWSMCYTKKYPLKAKHLAKLERITGSVEFKKQVQANRLAKIKALRSKTA